MDHDTITPAGYVLLVTLALVGYGLGGILGAGIGVGAFFIIFILC